jgi:hypothetical protein
VVAEAHAEVEIRATTKPSHRDVFVAVLKKLASWKYLTVRAYKLEPVSYSSTNSDRPPPSVLDPTNELNDMAATVSPETVDILELHAKKTLKTMQET